jgi:hypothetical protein
VPDTGALKTDLEKLAAGAAVRLKQPWATVMPSIIDVAERDSQLAELQSKIHGEMRGAFLTVIERAQQRGELPRSLNARELVSLILGPILYRRFFSRETLDEAFATWVVEHAMRAAK